MHLMALHVHGSSNPVGITGNIDRLPMHPYFIFKDLITVFVFLLIFSLFVFYSPNTLGHPDNYIPGNPMVTPPSNPIRVFNLGRIGIANDNNIFTNIDNKLPTNGISKN